MSFSLLVAVPTNSGAIDSVTAESLLQLQQACLARGYAFAVRMPSAAVISVLRNLIVADFLSSEADALFMLDADQGVRAETVFRMIDRGSEVTGCLYPKRRYNWAAVPSHQKDVGMDQVLAQATEFVGLLLADEAGGRSVRVEDGFARAAYVGTGAMLIRRGAFARLMGAYPDLRGRGFNPEEFAGPRFEANWGFFNPILPEEGGGLLPEDFSFCRRWTEAGGEIWAEVAATTVHVGRQAYSAAYLDWVRASGAG